MEMEGPAAIYGRTKDNWELSTPLATWKSGKLNVPKALENGRPVRWNNGKLLLFGFRPGKAHNHTEIFETQSHVLARIDDPKSKRSCFIVVNLATYASPQADTLLLHTQGSPKTGPIDGPVKDEPL